VVPEGGTQAGVTAEYYSIKEASGDEAPDDRDDLDFIATTAFVRKGLSPSVDVGLRGAVVPLPPLVAAGWIQGDVKLSLLQGSAGALALDPAIGFGAGATAWTPGGSDNQGGESEEGLDWSWRISPVGHLPLLAALGSESVSVEASVGPSVTRSIYHEDVVGWSSGPWLVAMRMTAGLSLRVSSKVRLQPEAVFAAPIAEAHYLRVVAGGISMIVD
jgi:hypothetical protein